MHHPASSIIVDGFDYFCHTFVWVGYTSFENVFDSSVFDVCHFSVDFSTHFWVVCPMATHLMDEVLKVKHAFSVWHCGREIVCLYSNKSSDDLIAQFVSGTQVQGKLTYFSQAFIPLLQGKQQSIMVYTKKCTFWHEKCLILTFQK